MSIQVEEFHLDESYINAELAAHERELNEPALGRIACEAQIYINPLAESNVDGQTRMRERKGYQVPEVCRAYNSLDPLVQYEATRSMLDRRPPADGRQFLAYEAVANLLDATMRHGKYRVAIAFEDEWREKGWEVLWNDPGYQKARQDVNSAVTDEARDAAVRTRNLIAIHIMAAISAGKYTMPRQEV